MYSTSLIGELNGECPWLANLETDDSSDLGWDSSCGSGCVRSGHGDLLSPVRDGLVDQGGEGGETRSLVVEASEDEVLHRRDV